MGDDGTSADYKRLFSASCVVVFSGGSEGCQGVVGEIESGSGEGRQASGG